MRKLREPERYLKFAAHHDFAQNGKWCYVRVQEHWVPEKVDYVAKLWKWHLPLEDPEVCKLHIGKFMSRTQNLFSHTMDTVVLKHKQIAIAPDIGGKEKELSDGGGFISPELML